MLPPRKMIFNTRPSSEDDDVVVDKRARSTAIEVHSPMVKPIRLGIAVTKSEHKMIRKRALELDLTINDYCRMKLLAPDDDR